MNFDQFFKAATGHQEGPFGYQRRLACGEQAGRSDWLTGPDSAGCRSRLINIPTGLGKTAAVVLAWLWNRLDLSCNAQSSALKSAQWPRRLVYCLPMRTLVEQTRDEVRRWVLRSARRYTKPRDGSDLRWLALHSPVILMGGEESQLGKRDWDIFPEKPCIIIGTQDMLLSRALNRGYGMSRYRWPMHFGLLNNDALWVVDETQLMGVGVETSAQLDGFRHKAGDSVVGACPTWWMSATLDAQRLATADHPRPQMGWPVVQLETTDRVQPEVQARLHARKRLTRAPFQLTPDTKKIYPGELATFVKDHHAAGSLTLVVVNTVARAREVFEALCKLGVQGDHLALVHSRFRLPDRVAQQARLLAAGDRIVVATQAVEAGVDVSARLLVTELAPWSSLVQRFGRCNRQGEFPDEARIAWIDVQPNDGQDELALPYDVAELRLACDALKAMDDASPEVLQSVTVPPRRVVRPVLRRKDLLDLFDTTPDLAGHDLDISRYIRDGEDSDVQVFWRDLQGEQPGPDEAEPTRPELCRVSLGRFNDFVGKFKKSSERQKTHASSGIAYAWNPLEEQWHPVTRAVAGGTYLLDIRTGGYSTELGWTGGVPKDHTTWVKPLPTQTSLKPDRGYGRNDASFLGAWVSLAEHVGHVEEQTVALVKSLNPCELPNDSFSSALCAAARWHDLGKAHAAFQDMLVGDEPQRRATLWAKSGTTTGRCSRPHFRHELASALAWLQVSPATRPEHDLVAYLIAAHHGKVRLSIRSLPGEHAPAGFPPETRIARGILEGDELPVEAFIALELGVSVGTTPLRLDLSFMEMGFDPARGASWLARMLALRDRVGPYRLAWLETILRAADGRASATETILAHPGGCAGVFQDMALRDDIAPYGPAVGLSDAEQSLVADLVADGLNIQDKFRPEPLYKQTGQGHYASRTVEEICQAKQISQTPKKL